MKKICKQLTAFMLIVTILFTTGCSSGFYADELSTSDISGNNEQQNIDVEDANFVNNTNENIVYETVSSNNADDSNTDLNYHIIEGDDESLYTWLELYYPNNLYSDFLSQSEDWWANLTDFERDLVSDLKDEDFYCDLDNSLYNDQSLSECVNVIIEEGVSVKTFFEGTWLEMSTLEELKYIDSLGYTMEDIYCVLDWYWSGVECEISEQYEVEKRAGITQSSIVKFVDLVISISTRTTGNENIGNSEARKQIGKAKSAPTEIAVPSMPTSYPGGPNHNPIYQIQLGGVNALCQKEGAHCNSSIKYHLAGKYTSGCMGYFASKLSSGGNVYVAVQIACWIYQKNGLNLTETRFKTFAMSRIRYMDRNNWSVIANLAWTYYKNAKNNVGKYTYYLWISDSNNAQPLVTYREPQYIDTDLDKPEEPVLPPTIPGEDGGDDYVPDSNILYDSYENSTTVTTTVCVNKTDIETGKPLQGVTFWYGADMGKSLVTDENGHCEWTVSEIFSDGKYWQVTTGDHEVKVGEDSHGNDIKETKYYYTCEECGQSGDYDSSGSRDTEGTKHCYKHCYDYVEASLDRQVAAYKISWSVTETMPRTTSVNLALVTGGSDSYTQGYHNNPIITASNTESGYHRGEHRVKTNNWTNERVRGTITINKSDMDYLNCRTEGDNNQDFIPQGDASLAGAVYGLYANADIIRPDGKSGDRTGLPTNIRMDYCTGSVDDPSVHKTYTGKNPFGIDAIHTTTPLDVPVHQVSYDYSDGTVYHKEASFSLFTLFTHREHPKPPYLCAFPACSRFGGNTIHKTGVTIKKGYFNNMLLKYPFFNYRHCCLLFCCL